MSHRHFFSRVLFCMAILLGNIAPSFGMKVNNNNNKTSEEEAYSNNQSSQNSYIPLKHFSEVIEESTFSAPSSNATPRPSKYCITFNKESITEMDQVFATAPIRAKRIVSRLKQENGMKRASYPGTIFWGEPGTGKTTTALSIAYQMQRDANWKPYYISSGALVKEHRHATAATLERMTNEMAGNKVPFIFIVDKVNLLLENTENKNHDTAATAIVLRAFLDNLINNPHCFFIGTANRIDKLEEPSKSRFEGKCINFPLVIDPAIKVAIFKTKLTDDRREKTITDADLIAALNPLQNCSGRNLTNLADLCEEVFLDHNTDSKQITVSLNHITLAVQELLQARIDLKCGQKQETDEER